LPLLWLSLAFLLGILLGEFLDWSSVSWLILAIIFLGISVSHSLKKILSLRGVRIPFKTPTLLSRIPQPPVYWALLLLSICFGAIRLILSRPDINPQFIAWYNDRDVVFNVEGVLVKPPDERDWYSNLIVETQRIQPIGDYPATEVEGTLLARADVGDDWHYGDQVRLAGVLETPTEEEEFSYRQYLERKGIYSIMPHPEIQLMRSEQGKWWLAWIFRVKEQALETVYQLYPDPEASLLAGILLGVESGIPEGVQRAFRDTGTSHIIAISGFNITIIAGILATVFGRMLGRGRKGARRGALIAMIGIVIYTILVGGDAAVVRAAIMGGLTLLAVQLGRQQDGLNSLALVAAVMALFNPYILWDVGFQLSFAATLGLVLLAEPFTNTFVNLAGRRIPSETAQRLSGPIGEYLLFTIAASLLTLPIILYHFQRLSLTSLIANPLILPVQPPVMILGGLAVILAMIFQPLGKFIAYLAWPFVVYTIRIVELLAHIPRGTITIGKISLLAVIIFYGILLTWIFAGTRIHEKLSSRHMELPSKLWGFLTLLLVVLTVVVWRAALSVPDGNLQMTVLNVGTGDAILIRTPTGRYLLIDGGPSATRLSDGLGRRLPLTNRELDYLVIGATGEEQLGALLTTIERFPPTNVLWAGPAASSRSSRLLRARLIEMNIPITTSKASQRLDLGEGAVLRVLAVSERGAVYLLEWKNFSALLPIGLDFETMDALQSHPQLTHVTALLLAENGYAPVNTPEWVSKWNPFIVLLSVGAGDQRGLPDLKTLEAVQGYNLMRTDMDGWIQISTDGDQMWVEVENR